MPRKSPDKSEGTEKVRARKLTKKEDAAEDAGVQAILAQTALAVAKTEIAKQTEDKLRAFLAEHKIEITTDDATAAIKHTAGSITEINKNQERDIVFVAYQLIDIFDARSHEEYKDGNLYDSLKYLTLVLACVTLSGAGLPLRCCKQIASIEKRLTLGGRFETLFIQTKPIFHKLAQLQPEVVTRHITQAENIKQLIAEAVKAEMESRWLDSIGLRLLLIKLNPAHPANYIFLSISLENIGRYTEALKAIETAVKLPTYRTMPHNQEINLDRIVRLHKLVSDLASMCAPLASPELSAPSEPPELPAPPTPERRTETILRYEQYLASVQKDSSSWPAETADGGGSGWRKIPEDELYVLQKVFGAFEKKMMTAGLHKQDKLSYRQLKTLLEQMGRGVINEHTLRKCAEECRIGHSRSVQIIKA